MKVTLRIGINEKKYGVVKKTISYSKKKKKRKNRWKDNYLVVKITSVFGWVTQKWEKICERLDKWGRNTAVAVRAEASKKCSSWKKNSKNDKISNIYKPLFEGKLSERVP